MSIAVMTAVWKHAPYSDGTLLTLLALADWADDEGICWPKIEQISKKARLTRSGAEFCLRKLRKDGVIKVIENSEGHKGHTYQIDPQYLRPSVTDPQPTKGETLSKPSANKEEPSLEPSVLTLSPPASESDDVKTKKPKKEPDARHQPFRTTLEKFWTHQNPGTPVPNWGVADAGQLGKFLKDWPTIDKPTFTQWLRNYDASEEINTSLRAYQLLPRLHEYASGPLNKFRKPLEEPRASA